MFTRIYVYIDISIYMNLSKFKDVWIYHMFKSRCITICMLIFHLCVVVLRHRRTQIHCQNTRPVPQFNSLTGQNSRPAFTQRSSWPRLYAAKSHSHHPWSLSQPRSDHKGLQFVHSRSFQVNHLDNLLDFHTWRSLSADQALQNSQPGPTDRSYPHSQCSQSEFSAWSLRSFACHCPTRIPNPPHNPSKYLMEGDDSVHPASHLTSRSPQDKHIHPQWQHLGYANQAEWSK